VAERRLHVGIAEHARQLTPPVFPLYHAHVARRNPAMRSLRHHEVMVGVGSDLGQVCDDEDLPARAPAPCDRGECVAHPAPDLPADPLVDLVEHQRGHGVVLGQHDLQGEHQAGQLTAGSDFRKRAGVEADVQPNLEEDVFGALGACSGERYQLCREAPTLQAEGR